LRANGLPAGDLGPLHSETTTADHVSEHAGLRGRRGKDAIAVWREVMMSGAAGDRLVKGSLVIAYALLADGTAIEIRPAKPADFRLVKMMHEAMSRDNDYRRFFGPSKLSAEHEAERVCRVPAPDHLALLALRGDDLVGVGSYEILGEGAAEIALAVADDMHGRGIGTLLLEHLGSAAYRQGVRTFTGPVLAENAEILKLFADAGLSARRQADGEVIEFTCDLPRAGTGPCWEPYQQAVARRGAQADVASLRHVFRPESVAVVGVSRRARTVGRAILHNVVTGGYGGRVYAVNPHATRMEGVPCLPSVIALPEPVDLAVIAVPPGAVPAVADECGRRGVKALVVVTAGLDAGPGADLLAACRRYGMRLVGPNCFGIAVPGIGLDATFAVRHPAPGVVGLVTQSGGLGLALVDRLSRLGLGISSFASVGSKYDISGDDLLMWWEQDNTTRLALLYIESFGNPRKFVRTARRVGRAMPVLAVQAPRSAAGPQAAACHAAAAAIPLVTREALLEQAGIVATDSLGELMDAAALLASQPPPAGRRLAVISNVGDAGFLAADACTDAGLIVHKLCARTRRRLRALVPAGGAVAGPVNTTVAVAETSFRRCLELVAADPGVDAVLALVLPTAATGDLITALRTAEVSVPLAAVVLDQAEAVRLLPRSAVGGPGESAGRTGSVPAYADPEAAARALARAAAYGAWRARPRGQLPEFSDVQTDDARELVRDFLAGSPRGGWLPSGQVTRLLGCYGIPLAGRTPAAGADGAAVCQSGTEVMIGVTQEPVFGPLVIFGRGGVGPGELADRAARLTPLTDTDAEELVRSVRSAPVLPGYDGAPPADLTALREILLRVSRLADDLPEVAELGLSPVTARADGVSAHGAKIRLTPVQAHDPFLRQLI
jgi:acyl-CoA synthetase (NDP forming)/GNAT superfamily N-acetyltransferase